MTTAIQVGNLGKRYHISQVSHAGPRGAYQYRTLRESLTDVACRLFRRRQRTSAERTKEFWALKDVTFEVKSGEVIGIIGRNGAGKSTLLKVLSRITKPTRGEVRLHGRVGSLLEVGTGFHPELTGRENVYLNGAILGMSRREVTRKFDEIVAFAGVEDFLDTPVKRFSSGMYVRLAFAVAAHLDPEILLVDEVLAVGDYTFQKKCVARMGDIAASGRTVLLVSHDLPMLSRLSTVGVWLDQGQLRGHGQPAALINAYCRQVTSSTETSHSVALRSHAGRMPGMAPIMQRVSLFDERLRPTTGVPLGGTLVIEVDLRDFVGQSDMTVMLTFCDLFGTKLAQAHSKIQSNLDLAGLRSARLACRIDDVRLVPGDYVLNLAIGDSSDRLDCVQNAIGISVTPADIYGTGKVPLRKDGLLALAACWEIVAGPAGGA
jgi:lipopolysaccharide transport system ATP-binding protein